MAWLAAEFKRLLKLRRPAPAKDPNRGCPPQCAEPLQSPSEFDLFPSSAEYRKRIEADFSGAKADLLRDSGSSAQSTLADARGPISGVTVRERSYEMKDLAVIKRRISSQIEGQTGL